MAIRISKVFCGNADLWIRLQSSYELRQAEKEFEEHPIQLDRIEFS
jgi:plasmid maintenance system antidote protein VapI